jgi:hypothetical protein
MRATLRWTLTLATLMPLALAARPAWPCSPIPGYAGQVFPGAETPVAAGTAPAVVWFGGFSVCTDLPCEFGDRVALYPGDLGDAVPPPGVEPLALDRTDYYAGLFATLMVLSPSAGGLEPGVYTLSIEYGEFSPWDAERHVIEVDGDRAAPGVATPAGLVWHDERFTGVAPGDSCTGSFDHRLFVTIAVDETVSPDDVVWYELRLEDLDGDEHLRVIVPHHLLDESATFSTVVDSGQIIPPSGLHVDCVSVVAVYLEGARSQPLRLCEPTKCVTRSPEDVFEPVDWSSLPACATGSEDGAESTDVGPSDAGGDMDAGSFDDAELADGPSSDGGGDATGADGEDGPADAADGDGPPSDLGLGLDRGSDAPGSDGSAGDSAPPADSGCCAVAAGTSGAPGQAFPWLLALLGGLGWRRASGRSAQSPKGL